MRSLVRDRISALIDEHKYHRQLERLNKKIDAAENREERAALVEEKIQLIRHHRLAKCSDIETPEV